MENFSSGVGLVPEQAWEDPDLPASPFGSDPATASIGFTDGKAAGSASPLTWAQAQELRLILALAHGPHPGDAAGHHAAVRDPRAAWRADRDDHRPGHGQHARDDVHGGDRDHRAGREGVRRVHDTTTGRRPR